MSSIKKGSTRRSDDTMDDDSDDKDSKRKSRNLSEKKRRDQFNLLVNELSSMVSTGGRKMDKSTVLKSTISFLKNHNEIAVRSRINEIQEDWKPTFLTNEEFTHLVLEAVDGFIMVFSSSGHIYYASESIASLLGHLPSAVLSMTIYDLASEDEQTNLYNLLLSPSEEEKQIVFSCHLRRGGPDAKSPPTYELVNFVGYFRSDEDMVQSDNRYSGYSGEADTSYADVMKQSRKDESDAMENPETSPSIGGNSAALPWPSKDGGKSIVRLGPASDCTSVSADSPAVRSTQRLRSNPIVNQQLSPSSQLQPHVQQLQPLQISLPQPQQISPQFLEPPQYLQAIPVQQMIANFPSPTVLSPLQPVDNIVLSPAQNQLQVDLQRKHAELQAIIGQQQQELRRVSEQLLMARLGLLPGSQPQPVVANVPISYQPSNTGIVSSTTTTVHGIPSGMPGPPAVLVPVSVPMSIPLQHQQHQHQPNIIYSAPDSNTQSK
ncbi:circadian locomoter output cycles protein kaput isoform X3 [Anoplophora glabripennis]|uniref:circadian locomoter output cycles protein kaput isoform X3 n=1 Tax=Anoplophora glabripennis TaxID=217634 RepID=UPI00087363EE|nr:circadian locomoter output cycles protein kaput isoform X3 [Anoplophora glabripennis]